MKSSTSPLEIELVVRRAFGLVHAESFWVQDASGQTVGWFYFRTDPLVANTAGVLLKDEFRRMAVNFARLPELLGKGDSG